MNKTNKNFKITLFSTFVCLKSPPKSKPNQGGFLRVLGMKKVIKIEGLKNKTTW